MAFNLCYVHMLVLRMVADVMQVMNNIKCGIYCFYVRHILTVGFPRHCAKYGHYFIRQLCCHLLSVHSIKMAHCADRQLVWRSDDGKWRTL